MTQKIKREVYIDPDQDEGLRKLAELMGVSEGELIERAICSYLDGGDHKAKSETNRPADRQSWLKELEFMKSRHMGATVKHTTRQTREDSYDEVLAERGLLRRPDAPEEDESIADWNTVTSKARSGYYGRLFSDVPPWNREGMCAERIARLPD